jgi:glycosyltransferase involved in cell wall biosynthesis
MKYEMPADEISFLMPICNEEAVIADVVAEWHESVIRHLIHPVELIFDDCSTDRTTAILEEMRNDFPYIRVMRSPRDGFFNTAMRLYHSARHPLIFFTDSDGQYVPEEFWRLTPFLAECDMVHGAKVDRQDPMYRVTASKVFNCIVKSYFSTGCDDVNSAFRLIKRPLLDKILPKIHHMPVLLNAEMLIRAGCEGYKIKNVPVAHRPRKVGQSRGLPIKSFHRDCMNAYRGLKALKKEYGK